MSKINLQHLFTESILDQTALDPGYEDHGSDVFRVTTASETVIARSFRSGTGSPFFAGLYHLFGIDPILTHNLRPLNARLNELSAIRVPQVLRDAVLDDGRIWVTVEYLPGHTLTEFAGDDLMHDFGVQLARIHSHTFSDYGNPIDVRWPLDTFHTRAAMFAEWLAEHFHSHDPAILNQCETMCNLLRTLPAPVEATYIQPDIGASQFLTDGNRITAWVDTEACVITPPVLDFIGLEYQISSPSAAAAFARGYGTIRALPQLSTVRTAYRYLYLLLDVEGDVPLHEWINHPILFA